MKTHWLKNISEYLWYPRQGVRYRIKGPRGTRSLGGNYRVYLNEKLLTTKIAFLTEAKQFAEEHFATQEELRGLEAKQKND